MILQQNAEKRTYLDYRATSKQKKSKRQPKSYSRRLDDKHQTKIRLASMLDKLGEFALADRMRLCGSKFTALTCGSHIIQRKPHAKCNSRFCPFCASRRARKLVETYAPKSLAFMRHSSVPVTPVHLVLTLSHRKTETAKQARQRLMKAFKTLTRRTFWLNHFLGGLYSVEFTRGTDDAWHCHLHVVAFRRRWFNTAFLRAEWLDITGDSHNLRLDPITDIRSGLYEAVKYATKPLDVRKFKLGHLRELLELKGSRMSGTFGEFAVFCRDYEPTPAEIAHATGKVELCAGDPCPICQDPLFELALGIEQLIGFARQIESVPRRKLTALLGQQ